MSENVFKLATTAITAIVTIVVGGSLMSQMEAKEKPEQSYNID